MLTPHSLSFLVSVVLAFVLAIPPNTCIVIVNLQSIRKKEKLSPSGVIFLAKGIVNILLQCLLSVQGMLFVWSPSVLYIREVHSFVNTLNCFLIYLSLWLTFWLSIHYCTSITNLRNGFFIWLKRIVSNFLNQILLLTTLGLIVVSVAGTWCLDAVNIIQSSRNSTEVLITRVHFHVNFFYFVPANILGCILPFFLTLLCLLLTFSFLVRHVWRVKNNDSGSTRPNLQAHVTALRTILLLLFIFTLFCVSQVLVLVRRHPKISDIILTVSWILRIISSAVEGAFLLQTSNKLKRVILRKFWTRNWRNSVAPKI